MLLNYVTVHTLIFKSELYIQVYSQAKFSFNVIFDRFFGEKCINQAITLNVSIDLNLFHF